MQLISYKVTLFQFSWVTFYVSDYFWQLFSSVSALHSCCHFSFCFSSFSLLGLFFSLALCVGDTFIFSLFTFDFSSEFCCLILYSEVREEKGIYASFSLRKYTDFCVWTYTLWFQGSDLMDSCHLLHETHISSADTPKDSDCFTLISRISMKNLLCVLIE